VEQLPKAVPCSECGTEPEMRHDEKRGLFMLACPNCKYHADPFYTKRGAIFRWNKINEVHRECLGCSGQPKLRYSKLRDMWLFQCRGCGWREHLSHTVQGAMTGWHRANEKGNCHTHMLWHERYKGMVTKPL